MKPNLRRQLITLFLILTLAVLFSGVSQAENYTAATMRLLRYEGDVRIEDAAGQPRFLMENARFASGEAMITGADGIASVGLDDSKILTLDVSTRVEFAKSSNAMKLTVREGGLLLDVREKLDEKETLDIETSTMVVGIRGTILFVKDQSGNPEEKISAATTLGVLEGVAQVTYRDADGSVRTVSVPAGQKTSILDAEGDGIADQQPALSDITGEDLDGFVAEQVSGDGQMIRRIEQASDLLERIGNPAFSFAADGGWTWGAPVTLVAQSASKLYDGMPLIRPSDVLVYNLPVDFSIRVSAQGSQTDAGQSENSIAAYTIYNAAGEDVTGHFTSVETVAGRLTVDPAPLTVWTGSAEKIYDGRPLTNPEAALRTVAGYEADEPLWRNTACVVTESIGSETLCGLNGSVLVHGTNPLTGETREVELRAGQRMTVFLNSEEGSESIAFKIESLSEAELPEDVLRLYAKNPDLLAQACLETGWDRAEIEARIARLSEDGAAAAQKDGLTVAADDADRLMKDFTNVRITIDTEITSYDGRALGGEEARFTGVVIDDSVQVRATGRRINVGQSPNTYEIEWGSVNPANYILREDLGTLTVRPRKIPEEEPEEEPEKEPETYDDAVTLSVSSLSKTYDGTPLSAGEVTVSGLPAGFTVSAAAEGSLTDAGSAEVPVSSYRIFDAEGRDVTGLFTNVRTQSGTITVLPRPLSVGTGSASKTYDGTALTAPEVSVMGLAEGDEIAVTATGSITDVGTTENTYSIEWGGVNSGNYTVTGEPGTLEITPNPAEIIFTAGSAERIYDGTPLISEEVSVSGLPEGFFGIGVTSGSQTDAGSGVNAVESYAILNESETDVTAFFSNVTRAEGTLTVTPAPLTVATSPGAKMYDGTALTAPEVSVMGLAEGDEIAVTATGSITDVGTAENTYSIDWGEVNSGNYTVTEELGTLEVTENSTLITISSGSASDVYRGWALKNGEYTVSGLPEGISAEVTVSGEQAVAGTGENTISGYVFRDAEGEDKTAYFTNVTLEPGTLTLEKAKINVWSYCGTSWTSASDSYPYKGSGYGVGVAWRGVVGADNPTPSDLSVTFTYEGSVRDAGTYTLSYTAEIIREDLKDNYEIGETQFGTVTITPVPLTVTTPSLEKPYDGTPLTGGEASVEGLCGADEVIVTVTGSQTEVGSSENGCSIDWNGVNPANYEVTLKTGTLTVTGGATITVTAQSFTSVYSGQEQSGWFGVTVEGVPEGVDYLADPEVTWKDAGTYTLVPSISLWDKETFEDVADHFTIVLVNGTLTVTPAPLTVTTGSGSKPYDGTPLTSSEAALTGLVGEDAGQAAVTATGTVTDVGTVKNTYTLDWGEVNPANYSIVEELGTLEVTAAGEVVPEG